MRNTLNAIALPMLAIAAALGVFGVFVSLDGVSPVDVWVLLFKGAFGDWFSWQNTLQRAAPLMLTALCVAVPARAGLVSRGHCPAHVANALVVRENYQDVGQVALGRGTGQFAFGQVTSGLRRQCSARQQQQQRQRRAEQGAAHIR